MLVVVGDFDLAFCEASFYPADACAESAIIPGAGHDLNLHVQAQLAYDTVLEWMDRRVGSDTRVVPPSPCQP